MAKATIKIKTNNSRFRQDQLDILRRYINVLYEHELFVTIKIKSEIDSIDKESKLKVS